MRGRVVTPCVRRDDKASRASISPDDKRSLHDYSSIQCPCLRTLCSTHRKCIL